MKIIEGLDATPRTNQVYSRMGFKPQRSDIPASMKPLVEEAFALAEELIEPSACYEYRDIEFVEPKRIDLVGAFSIFSEKVRGWMEGCTGIYLTAVTLGPKLDRKVAELSAANDVTRGFLLNAYGAEAAEALMVRLDQHISRLAQRQGFETTKRYSPGYGDWEISAQKDVLGLLEAERIGIALTPQFLMVPEKSVSAIIGIKPQAQE